jgi:hypothetical protein
MDDDFGRLIYLASALDRNTGKYFAQELASLFPEPVAARALATCHREVFLRLVLAPLKSFVGQLESHLRSSSLDWQEQTHENQSPRSYDFIVPPRCHPVTAKLFLSNIKISLALLRFRSRL